MTLDFYLYNFHKKYITLIENFKSSGLVLAKLIKIYLLHIESLKTKCNQVLNVQNVTIFPMLFPPHSFSKKVCQIVRNETNIITSRTVKDENIQLSGS